MFFQLTHVWRITINNSFVYAHIAHKRHINYTPGMKIYFTSSTAEFDTYKDDYFYIRDFLINKAHILTRDWLTPTSQKIDAGDKNIKSIKDLYKACIQAIKEADLVIVEDTVSNFSTGHQITLALQLKKPTLVLWQNKKHRHFNQMFIHGVESDILEVSEYNRRNIDDILEVFISKYEKFSEKNRFHLVLSNVERMYIDWSQFVKGKSRTKVIREALRTVIDNDKEYNEYLKTKN